MEYIDIYDRDKNLTGLSIPRKDYFLLENQYAVIVIGLIERPDHRFLVTRRALDKKWAGGWWEVPGGGVRAGENSKEAVIREIREETGIDISEAAGGRIYTYARENLKKGDNYFVDIYHFHLDFDEKAVRYNQDEIIDCRLMTWDEMTDYNCKGIFLHYDRLKEGLEQEERVGLEPADITRFYD